MLTPTKILRLKTKQLALLFPFVFAPGLFDPPPTLLHPPTNGYPPTHTHTPHPLVRWVMEALVLAQRQTLEERPNQRF